MPAFRQRHARTSRIASRRAEEERADTLFVSERRRRGGLQCDSRERSEQSNNCAGLYVCEMITSRGLVERDRKTLSMLQFDPGERVRSVQLYGVDPAIMAQATDILCNEYGVASCRSELRLPGPQGHSKGWRRGAAIQTRPAANDLDRYGRKRPHVTAYQSRSRLGSASTMIIRLSSMRAGSPRSPAVRPFRLHGRTAQQAYAANADWEAIGAEGARLDTGARQWRHLGGGGRTADGQRDRSRRRGHRPRLLRPSLVVP